MRIVLEIDNGGDCDIDRYTFADVMNLSLDSENEYYYGTMRDPLVRQNVEFSHLGLTHETVPGKRTKVLREIGKRADLSTEEIEELADIVLAVARG